MGRYFVRVRSQSRISREAVKSANLAELRTAVARFVGQLLLDHSREVWSDEEWQVDVTDEDGLILYTMLLTVSDTAATMQLKK